MFGSFPSIKLTVKTIENIKIEKVSEDYKIYSDNKRNHFISEDIRFYYLSRDQFLHF